MAGQASPRQGVIDTVLQLALAGVDMWRREASAGAAGRLLVALAAGAAAGAAAICFSAAAWVLLVNRMTPAEAWAVLGVFYGVAGGMLYLVASRRR